MSFSYLPMTDAELQKIARENSPLLEPGTYDFEVIKATAKTSKSNNPMIELQLKVWSNSGKEFTVFDYLVSTPGMAWKIKHFCHSVGLLKEYSDGQFNEVLCQGKCGKAKIVYQAGKAKPEGGFYKDKNSIEDYILKEVKNDSQVIDDNFNDPLPF